MNPVLSRQYSRVGHGAIPVAGLVSTAALRGWIGRRVAREYSSDTPLPVAGQTPVEPGFVRFLAEQREPLLAFLRRRGAAAEDAQDVAQESMVKLLRYRTQPPEALRVLLYRIALNGFSDLLRRGQARGAGQHVSLDADFHDLPSADPGPVQRLAAEQQLRRLRQGIQALPPRCREVYLLHRVENMSYPQIARHCGITVKAVEKNIGKALACLRLCLKEEKGR